MFVALTFAGTSTGPRVKTQRGRGGYVANVTFRNFSLSGVGEAIQVRTVSSHILLQCNCSIMVVDFTTAIIFACSRPALFYRCLSHLCHHHTHFAIFLQTFRP